MVGGGPLSKQLGNGSKEWEVSAWVSLENRSQGCIPDPKHNTAITANHRRASVFARYCVSVNHVANFLLDGYHHQAGIQLCHSPPSGLGTDLVAYLPLS